MQISLRLPDDLAADLKSTAARDGRSVNSWLVDAVRMMLDPTYAPSDMERLRDRLRRAGLLAEYSPLRGRKRPSEEALRPARAAAGRGKPLSDYVSEDRD